MKSRWRAISLVSAGLVLVSCAVAATSGASVNTSRSIPIGLYWATTDPVKRGAYVMFCPPRTQVFGEARERGYIGSGFCPGGYGYLMKKVLAIKNDVVSVEEDGVRVNGKLLSLSKPLAEDGALRPLPRYRIRNHVLTDSELMLMSDGSPTSFDGRYFGPIQRQQLKSVIRPIWTWSTK